ncbi:MAG: C-GCAxxG-C-C family protein [Clostridia bacterium]
MTRREQATAYFKEGYNCCQSVVLTFKDLISVDQETALKMASPFGGGMGRLRQVCGAVSGMFIVLGSLYGYTEPTARAEKVELYGRVQALAKEFSDKNGSIVCRELLEGTGANLNGEERNAEYYKKRPCADLVGDAAEILENFINSVR